MKRLTALVILAVALAGLVTGYVLWLEHSGISVEEARATLPHRLAAKQLAMGEPVFIRIFKEESVLELWMRRDSQWVLFQTYPVCQWSGTLGPKLKTGDKQAPEGFYRVGLSQLNPHSRHHLAFNLGFPNDFDRSLGRTGSYLMIHGGCSSAGCYAMTNGAVDDIYRLVEAALKDGQPGVDVHIFPFRMTESNLKRYAASQWVDFWRSLKGGYDVFEQHRMVPAIQVVGRSYVVEG
jgi:murein L,D-transpeptidase YafK